MWDAIAALFKWLLGRDAAERTAQAVEAAKAAEEARRVEDDVARLPDDSLDRELRKWAKPGDRQ
jgi:hypothetical protein